MRIFSNFFKGRDAPVNRTSGSAYSFFMGGSTSGKRVNERREAQTVCSPRKILRPMTRWSRM